MEIEQRIIMLENRLDNLQRAYEQSQRNQFYINEKVDNSNSRTPQIDKNAKEVEINEEGLYDVADLSGKNSDAVFDLAEYVTELEARVAALEGGNNG